MEWLWPKKGLTFCVCLFLAGAQNKGDKFWTVSSSVGKKTNQNGVIFLTKFLLLKNPAIIPNLSTYLNVLHYFFVHFYGKSTWALNIFFWYAHIISDRSIIHLPSHVWEWVSEKEVTLTVKKKTEKDKKSAIGILNPSHVLFWCYVYVIFMH